MRRIDIEADLKLLKKKQVRSLLTDTTDLGGALTTESKDTSRHGY